MDPLYIYKPLFLLVVGGAPPQYLAKFYGDQTAEVTPNGLLLDRGSFPKKMPEKNRFRKYI